MSAADEKCFQTYHYYSKNNANFPGVASFPGTPVNVHTSQQTTQHYQVLERQELVPQVQNVRNIYGGY